MIFEKSTLKKNYFYQNIHMDNLNTIIYIKI
jgi:hypothetical protein